MMLQIINFLYEMKILAKKAKIFLTPARQVSYIQKLNIRRTAVKKLGSIYGAKSFLEQHLSDNPIMLSLGVGEDITFIEFIANYDGCILI